MATVRPFSLSLVLRMFNRSLSLFPGDEYPVLVKYFFAVGALGIDPEFQHAAWAMKATRYEARTLALADAAQIDKQ